MPSCSICTHSKRAAIDKALVVGDTHRNVAKRFFVSESALYRHKNNHLPETLKAAKAEETQEQALDVMEELRRCFVRINLLFDACDRWLRDPANPEQYDVGPRAHEIMVIYETQSKGRMVTRKAKLSELLAKIEKKQPGDTITMVETKHVDIRDLTVKTAARLQPQIELLAKLTGEIDDKPVNVFISPMWSAIEQSMRIALEPYPDARAAVSRQLAAIEVGDS